jgi:hypothetical protein
MSQYPDKITNIQVDITSIIMELIAGVPSHVEGVEWLQMIGYCHIGSQQEKVPKQVQASEL